MTLPGPLRFRVIADEIVEEGGQTLASLNLDCIPSILDEFTLFIDDVGKAGATDEVVEILFPDEEEVAGSRLTTYQQLRDRLADSTIGGLVPLPIALLILREGINTVGDEEDTAVGEPQEDNEEPWIDDNGSDENAATPPLHGTIEHGSGDPAGGVIGDTVTDNGNSA